MELEPLLIGKKKAAELISLSPRQVDYLIERGELEAVHVGRRVLVPYRALLKFARARTKTPKVSTDVGSEKRFARRDHTRDEVAQ